MKVPDNQKPVVLFDGVCNLCNGAVQFIIKNEKQPSFLFASLQSEFGQKFLKANQLDEKKFRTLFVLKPDGSHLSRSTAALWIAAKLRLPWKMLSVCWIVPRFLRDWVYDLVARYRYRIFGKKDACLIPSPDLKKRFLD